MHGGDGSIRAPSGESPKKGPDEPPQAGNPGFRNSALNSAKTGAEIIPILHSRCSDFMDADARLLEAWKGVVHEIDGLFGDDIRLDAEIQGLVARTAGFGSQPDVIVLPAEGMFAVMVDEIYARHGHYEAIFGICEKILGFEKEDREYALPLAHTELAIAALARRAIEQKAPSDRKVIERCAGILKRRAEAIRPGAPPGDSMATFEEILDEAKGLAEFRRRKNATPWKSKYASKDPPPKRNMFDAQLGTIDTSKIPAIKTVQDGCHVLGEVTSMLREAREHNLKRFHGALRIITLNIGEDVPFDDALQKYVIDMARYGSGAAELLACAILIVLGTRRKMYDAVCCVCEEMGDFEGDDAQRMDASTLIECTVADLLRHMSYEPMPSTEDVTKRCATLLGKRSGRLGLGRAISHYPGYGSELTQAEFLATDISLRRRMRDEAEISSWVRDHYPCTYKFLDMENYTRTMIKEENSMLATHISDLRGIVDLALTREINHEPGGTLDSVEALLVTMKEEHVDYDLYSGEWRANMRTQGLSDAILEMDVYLRCKYWYRDKEDPKNKTGDKTKLYVEPHPKIKCGEADVRAGKCHIEAYFPQERFSTATCYPVERSIPELCCKIMDKKQIDNFGDRESMLLVKCDENAFRSGRLRKLLKMRMKSRCYLGGVLLVLHHGDHYEPWYIKNCGAPISVPKSTIREICCALEKPIAMGKKPVPQDPSEMRDAGGQGHEDSQCGQGRAGGGSLGWELFQIIGPEGIDRESFKRSEHLTTGHIIEEHRVTHAEDKAFGTDPETKARKALESLQPLTLEAIGAIEESIMGGWYAQEATFGSVLRLGRWLDEGMGKCLETIDGALMRHDPGHKRIDEPRPDWDNYYFGEFAIGGDAGRVETGRGTLAKRMLVLEGAVADMTEALWEDKSQAEGTLGAARSLGELLREARRGCMETILEAMDGIEADSDKCR